MSFEKFELSKQLMMGLQDLQYKDPTPIQDECIPLVLNGQDVIGAAQTGTGKTGAFVIPLLQKIITSESDHTRALILSPTRELAQQIEEQIFALGYHTNASSATVTGGSDYGTQVKAIRAGVDIIVATPGRLIDQMNVLNIDFDHLDYLVLDEADRMLDMGFLPDVMKIVKQLPQKRQTLLFSATMVEEVQKVVDEVMNNPVEVEFEVSKPAESVDQQIFFVESKNKLQLFEHLFDAKMYETAIVFMATKRGTDKLERRLKKRGVNAVSMHGDRDQQERNEALRKFKNKTHPVMVATDVISRGIDIDDVSLIVNFDVPNNPEDYIHRIGRTGRYDKTGTAITFVSKKDKKYYHAVKKVVGDQLSVKEVPDDIQGGRNKRSPKKPKKKAPQNSSSRSGPKRSKRSASKGSSSERSGSSQKKPKKDSRKQTERSRSKEASRKSKKPSKAKSSAAKHQEETSQEVDQRVYDQQNGHVEKDIFQPEIIEKAVVRNRRSLKPAKGIWGVIKSFIPKIGS